MIYECENGSSPRKRDGIEEKITSATEMKISSVKISSLGSILISKNAILFYACILLIGVLHERKEFEHSTTEPPLRKFTTIITSGVQNVQTETPKAASLKIVVLSNASRFDRRDVIRYTWAHPCWLKLIGPFYNITFIIGTPANSSNTVLRQVIQQEHKEYQDMIQLNLTEEEFNFPSKIVAGLELIKSSSSNYRFALIVTDEFLFNPKNITRLLSNVSEFRYPRYFAGFNAQRPKDVSQMTVDSSLVKHNDPFYPPFIPSNLMLMSRPMAGLLLVELRKVEYESYADIGLALHRLAINNTVHLENVCLRADDCNKFQLKQSLFVRNNTDGILLTALWNKVMMDDHCLR